MNQLWDRIVSAVKRRPVRVVEAVIVLVGTLGLVIDPEATEAILTLVALTLAGGEIAQTRTSPYEPEPDGIDADE